MRVVPASMSVQRPAAKRVHVICGNVNSRRDLRPKVSMVQKAGKAKSQLTMPKPKEPRRASKSPMFASLKMVVE